MGAASMDEQKANRVARIVFAVALLAAGALLLHYRLKIGFYSDDLVFIKERTFGGIDDLLRPHNEHIVVLQVAIYKLFFSLFGIDSSAPLQTVSLLGFLAAVVAFFVWIRDRVGEPAAALAAIPVLFLGTAYQDLLWTFQIGYSVSILGGLVALIALDREGRYSRPVACAALVVAVTVSSLGLTFLVGVGVLLLLRAGWKGPLTYVLAIPFLIYLAWYIGWGHTAESFITLTNVLNIPRYMAEGQHAVVTGLTGLHELDSTAGDLLGWLVTILVFAVVVATLIRRKVLPEPLLVAAALGFTFWALSGANHFLEIRDPDQSRYQLPGAIFLLMILAGAFEGLRPGKGLLAAMALLSGLSVVFSLGLLSSGQKELTAFSDPPKAAMTALDIAGDQAVGDFKVRLIPVFPYFLDQDEFDRLENRYGRAGWTEDQLAGQTLEARRLVDGELVAALGIELRPGDIRVASNCRLEKLKPTGTTIALLPSGRLSIVPRDSDAVLTVGRFAEPSVQIGTAEAGRSTSLEFPSGDSMESWRVDASGTGVARVCSG